MPLPENWKRQENFQFKHQASSSSGDNTPEPAPGPTTSEEEKKKTEQQVEPEIIEISDSEESSTRSDDSLPTHPSKKVRLTPVDEDDVRAQSPEPQTRPTKHASPVNIHTSRRKVNRAQRPTASPSHPPTPINGIHHLKSVLEELEKQSANDKSTRRSPKRARFDNMKADFINNSPFTQTNGDFSMNGISEELNAKPTLLEKCLSGIDQTIYNEMYFQPVIQGQPTCLAPLDTLAWERFSQEHETYLNRLNDTKMELLSLLHRRLMKDTQHHVELTHDPNTMKTLVEKDLIMYEHLGKLQLSYCQAVAAWAEAKAYRAKFGMRL